MSPTPTTQATDGLDEDEILLREFQAATQTAQHIIVIAGAGLSAASGIPTFRDGGGLWRSLDATSLATPSAFAANPSLVWQFYHYRRVKALEARPNKAHNLLAKLSVPSLLKTVAPAAKTYHLITQNVDGLSTTALHILEAKLSSSDCKKLRSDHDKVRMDSIIEMHGRIFNVKCTECDYCEEDLSNPLRPSLDTGIGSYHDAGSKEVDIPESALPRSPSCGALARPGVVFFDEKPYRLDEINSLVYKADLCLVVGTSSTVRPASTYAYRVQRHKGKVAVFNIAPSEGDERADFVFRGPCEEQMLRAFPQLEEDLE